MAANLNPFEQEDDFIEDEISVDTKPREKESSPEMVLDFKGTTMDGVAAKLLKDNFILTALELHTELLESGRELPRLRDYFSNPANFERTRQNEASSPGLRK